jgi:hypothetical protein
LLDRLAARNGSVLIEALAALAIISLTVVASLNGFAESIHRLQQAEERLSALGEARSLVARTSGAEALSTGTIRGETPSGRTWTVVVEEASPASGGVRLFRISTAVESKRQKAPLIMLRTLTVTGLKPE